jgi:hypothetical protein
VADAGPNQIPPLFQGDRVQLDGSGSYDTDGNPLTYSWSLITMPQGSNAKLDDPTLVNPSFITDVRGIYVAQLIVNDGFFDSDPDTVKINKIFP